MWRGCAGAKTPKEVYQAFENIYPVLGEFRKGDPAAAAPQQAALQVLPPPPTRAAGRDSGVCLSRSSSDICLDKTGSYGTPSQQSEAKTTTSFLMGRRRDQRLQDLCRALPKGRDPHHSALQLHVSRDTA